MPLEKKNFEERYIYSFPKKIYLSLLYLYIQTCLQLVKWRQILGEAVVPIV